MSFIFKTENFYVRRLKLTDFEAFHEMQGNINVMRFVRAKAMTYEQDKEELIKLINSYDKIDTNFWIYAIERKIDTKFVGTIALVRSEDYDESVSNDELILNIKKDECEIGYRFLEKYWGKGYGFEITEGLIKHSRAIGFTKLIAHVANENIASAKIIEKLGFTFVKKMFCEDLKLEEKKFELIL